MRIPAVISLPIFLAGVIGWASTRSSGGVDWWRYLRAVVPLAA